MNLLIKPFLAKRPSEETIQKNLQRQALYEDMKKAREDMDAAYANFDYVTDPALIDASIYKVNAVLKRYQYLKEQAEKLDSPPAQIMADVLSKEASASASVI